MLLRYSRLTQIEGVSRWAMIFGYCIKVLVGLYFLFIYSEFYGSGMLTADAGDFMREGKLLNDVFYSSPIHYFKFLTGWNYSHQEVLTHLGEINHWDVGAQSILNDNRNILRFHSVIHFISFGDPVIHMLVLSFISLLGIKHMVIGVKGISNIYSNFIFWIFLLAPSVIFWGSSLLKEPLMLLGIGLFIRGAFANDPPKKKWILIVLGMFFMLGFKPYVFIAMIPALLFVGIYRIIPKYKLVSAFTIMLAFVSLPILILSEQRDALLEKVARKQADFKNIGTGGLITGQEGLKYYFLPEVFEDLSITEDTVRILRPVNARVIDYGGLADPYDVTLYPDHEALSVYFYRQRSSGYFDITQLDGSIGQLFQIAPEALSNTLLRPYPTDGGSWLRIPAIIEIWAVLLFLALAIYRRRKFSEKERVIFVALVLFTICLSLIIGWTTPVLGALVRYRVPVIVSLLIMGVMLLRTRNLVDKQELNPGQ